MKFTTAKVALAIFCLNGTINIQDNKTDHGYFDDGSDYWSASASLNEGWGWRVGFNKAHAFDTDYDNMPNDMTVTPTDSQWDNMDPDIIVYDDGSWDDGPVDDPWAEDDTYGYDQQDDGDSGGSGSTGTIDAQEQCELNASLKKTQCLQQVAALAALEATACILLGITATPVAGAICAAAATAATTSLAAACNAQYDVDKALCD